MRRLIPYIASDYRKDRIWLRRTKMDKRNCNVAMAVDCSSSMNDNLATELTAQSIALLNKSFELLQIGQISVVKFGTDVQILRDFAEDIDEFGPKLLQSLKFDEPRTDIVKLLNCMVAHFEEARVNSTNVSDQLLIILGDGRFSGASSSQVRNSVGRLFDEGVTVLYVILDNPASSIFNVKVFKNKQLVSYMHDFPFAFYTGTILIYLFC
jgi:midasin